MVMVCELGSQQLFLPDCVLIWIGFKYVTKDSELNINFSLMKIQLIDVTYVYLKNFSPCQEKWRISKISNTKDTTQWKFSKSN